MSEMERIPEELNEPELSKPDKKKEKKEKRIKKRKLNHQKISLVPEEPNNLILGPIFLKTLNN